MRNHQLLSSIVTVALTVGTITVLNGQTPAASATKTAKATTGWKMPRTPWGAPDLQGVWSNATITPLQRPTGQEKPFVTEEEAQALDTEAATRYDRRSADPKADLDAAYNQGGTTAAIRWRRARAPSSSIRRMVVCRHSRLRGRQRRPSSQNVAPASRGGPKTWICPCAA